MQMLLRDKMGVEQRKVMLPVRIQKPLLVLAAGLALVQRDQHRHRLIEGDLHQDVVELLVIEAEHVQIERDADPRQHVLENVVDVVASHIEQMEVLAGAGREDFFLSVGLQVEQVEALQARRGIGDGVADVGFGWSCGRL